MSYSGAKIPTQKHSLTRARSHSHLDAVRALAFVHETSGDKQLSIVSGGDDMTVKVWRHLNVLATYACPSLIGLDASRLC